MNDLERAFRRAMISAMDNRGRSGLLGKTDGTVTYTDDSGNNYRNLVWVRIITDAGVTLVVAENNGVPLQPNLPIRVDSINGTPTVIGTDTKKANIFTGGFVSNVSEHAWMHGRFGPDPIYITGAQFLPLMARPTSPADMTVTVGEGWYRWNSIINIWEQGTTSSLSSYVPSQSGIQHYIILSLNRSTNTLTITDGSSKLAALPSIVPFTNSEILAIVQTLGVEQFPIATIRFYYGQTTIKAPDIFKDLRLWGGEINTSATFDPIMIDADYAIMYDADNEIMEET